jgi:guanylate kinase
MYATSLSTVDEALITGKVLILDVDVNGAIRIKKAYPKESVTIFIHPPNLDVLNERLIKRGSDSQKKIKERLERTSLEIKKSNEFDIEVVNINIVDTVEKISNEIKKINERKK